VKAVKINKISSHDWESQHIAASIVPRGMEVNTAFMKPFATKLQNAIFVRLMRSPTVRGLAIETCCVLIDRSP
jgi:selenophosphate synthase